MSSLAHIPWRLDWWRCRCQSAESLGTTASTLNEYSDAVMALGRSHEEVASSIQSATKNLRELQIEGKQSKLFEELSKAGGKAGRDLARELSAEIAGPRAPTTLANRTFFAAVHESG